MRALCSSCVPVSTYDFSASTYRLLARITERQTETEPNSYLIFGKKFSSVNDN